MKNSINSYKKFILVALFSVAATIFFSYHVANVLFGNNSFEVYDSLKHKKSYLQNEILRLQQENAFLQKEYLELKNLEPEE
jgi:cell division protein FtsB